MRLHLTLRTSLFAAFGLLALLCAGQGTLSIVELGGIRSNVREVTTNWLPSVVTITNISAAASDVRIKQLRALALTENAEQLAEIDGAVAALAAARKTYEPLISSSEERSLYEAFGRAWDQYQSIGREAVRLVEAGRAPEGVRLMSEPANINLYAAARDILAKDVALNERGAHEDAGSAMAATDSATTAAYVAIGLSLAAACAAAAFVQLRVSRPIQAMTGAMTVLAAGDTNAAVPGRAPGRDRRHGRRRSGLQGQPHPHPTTGSRDG